MGNSSKNNSSKKKILYAVIAVVAVIAIYFIATKFSGGQLWPFDFGSSVTQSTDEIPIVIDGTPDNTPGGSGSTAGNDQKTAAPQETSSNKLDENGAYYSKEDVALYINTYGKLPSNFITKDQAKSLGWSGNGNDPVDKYAPGKAIGGDYFGNYEGLLPKKKGRSYTECDIDTKGTVRGVKRIIFSNDGLIYYTEDHYEHFKLLYGTP